MTDYAIELAVLQPSLLMGQLDGLSPFSMHNPHGIVIALADLAYLLKGVSFLSIAGALPPRGGALRATRITFLVAGVLAVVSLVGLAGFFGRDRGYRYEVAAILIDWLALTASGVLLAVASGAVGSANIPAAKSPAGRQVSRPTSTTASPAAAVRDRGISDAACRWAPNPADHRSSRFVRRS